MKAETFLPVNFPAIQLFSCTCQLIELVPIAKCLTIMGDESQSNWEMSEPVGREVNERMAGTWARRLRQICDHPENLMLAMDNVQYLLAEPRKEWVSFRDRQRHAMFGQTLR